MIEEFEEAAGEFMVFRLVGGDSEAAEFFGENFGGGGFVEVATAEDVSGGGAGGGGADDFQNIHPGGRTDIADHEGEFGRRDGVSDGEFDPGRKGVRRGTGFGLAKRSHEGFRGATQAKQAAPCGQGHGGDSEGSVGTDG